MEAIGRIINRIKVDEELRTSLESRLFGMKLFDEDGRPLFDASGASTKEVFIKTIKACKSIGMSIEQMAVMFDVNEHQIARAWAEYLREQTVLRGGSWTARYIE